MALNFHIILTACAMVMKASMAARPGMKIETPSSPTGPLDEYQTFRRQHRPGQDPEDDHVSYATRASLFQARSAEVEAHNAQPRVSYMKEVNRFADHTDAELRSMLGYRRGGHLKGASDGGSFLQMSRGRDSDTTAAKVVDWRNKLNSSRNFIRDQGPCGSCWAVAAVGALEMHAEALYGPTKQLSYEELVDCVENKHHCGGDGGCKGATAELAFEYVKNFGLSAANGYKGYQSGGSGQCSVGGYRPNQKTTRATGWERLPTNSLPHLMEALTSTGPVVGSVDASGWSSYARGIYDGCGMNSVVNHAIVIIGYGYDDGAAFGAPSLAQVDGDTKEDFPTGRPYWLIRNSWGPSWGENGYIRILRHMSDRGDEGYCGIDSNPKEGVGCDGGPSQIPVCGMCGILSDSSYPTGVHIHVDITANEVVPMMPFW